MANKLMADLALAEARERFRDGALERTADARRLLGASLASADPDRELMTFLGLTWDRDFLGRLLQKAIDAGKISEDDILNWEKQINFELTS